MSLKSLMRILVIVSVLGWAEIAHAVALTDDLVAYWTLDEASGTRSDSVGSSHLTDHNGVGVTTGIVGNAAQFTASLGQYLSSSSNSSLAINTDQAITIAAWAKLDSTPAESMGIVNKGIGSGGDQWEYSLHWLTAEGKLNVMFSNQARTTGGDISSVAPTSTDIWNFVVGWHDPTLDRVFLQINNATPFTAQWDQGTLQGDHILAVGAITSGPSFAEWYWDGAIDEVGIWKRTLTTDERTTLFGGVTPLSQPLPLSLGIEPLSQSVGPGSVEAALVVSGLGASLAPSLGLLDFNVTFDPSILAFNSVTFGDPILGDQLDLTGLGSTTAATPGVGTVNLFRQSLDSAQDLNTLQAGEFRFGTLKFDTLGLGTSPLALAVNDSQNAWGYPFDVSIEDASVTVTPEPASLLLFGSGLLGLMGWRRRFHV